MSTYMDNPLEHDDIEDEEELIEAVEHLVETAAVWTWSGIMEDFQGLCASVQMTVEFLFPILVVYQQDPNQIADDARKTGLYLLLLTVAYFVLAPSRKTNHRKSPNALTVVTGIYSSRRKPFTYQHNSYDGITDDAWPSSSSQRHFSSHCQTAPNSDNWSETPSETRFLDEETDEDRFERIWPKVIANSDYHLLVLPPICRRLQPAERRAAISDKPADNQDQVAEDDETAGYDDKPVERLQSYVRNILGLIRSFLSYDYAAAGWTLLSWLQGIRQKRRTNSSQFLDQMNEDSSVVTESRRNPLHSTRSNTSMHSSVSMTTAEGPASPFGTPKQRLTIPNFSNSEEKKDTEASTSSSYSVPFLPRSYSGSQLLRSESCDDETDSQSKTNKSLLLYRDDDIDEPPQVFSRRRLRSSSDTDLQKSGLILNRAVSSVAEGVEEAEPQSPRPSPAAFESQPQQSQSFFFESANSKETLKKFTVEVAVPDKNGYILGDDFLPDSRHTPLLVFVNSRSGPQQGHLLITQLRRLLNPIQVWDLANGGPEEILDSFLVLTRLRILVCGGDGTVSWIISALEKMKLDRKWPPIAILPLGTGNDLARIHGWGGGYNNESLLGILKQVSESYVSMLDRWELSITVGRGQRKKTESKDFFNYLGVGADAQAALQVHYLRESRPDWFFSRIVNKAWYGVFGAEDIIKASCVNVRKEVRLFADGVEIPLPHDSQGIILLNIDSYAGGVPLWSHGEKEDAPHGSAKLPPRRTVSMVNFSSNGPRRNNSYDSLDDMQAQMSEEERKTRVTACDRPSSCQDGLLDVVSIGGAFHLGQIKVGLSNAQRLCQCREVTIILKNKVAVQVDGEPWRQRPCTLRIRRKKESATMLHRSSDDGGVETEMSKLLEWAEERHLIDGHVHSILLKEFSRRIESKTRQRRGKPKKNKIMSTLKRAMSTSKVSNAQAIQMQGGGIAF